MDYKYKYTDSKTGKLLFETKQPSHVNDSDVDEMFKNKTGRDYRLEKAIIEKEIRVAR